MGGQASQDFKRFREHCFNAFLILRRCNTHEIDQPEIIIVSLYRSANLFLNLFSLMVHTNVQDIAIEPDKAVKKVGSDLLDFLRTIIHCCYVRCRINFVWICLRSKLSNFFSL